MNIKEYVDSISQKIIRDMDDKLEKACAEIIAKYDINPSDLIIEIHHDTRYVFKIKAGELKFSYFDKITYPEVAE